MNSTEPSKFTLVVISIRMAYQCDIEWVRILFYRFFLSVISFAIHVSKVTGKISGQEFAGEVEGKISPLLYDSVLVYSGQGFWD